MYWLIGYKPKFKRNYYGRTTRFGVGDNIEILDDITLAERTVSFKEFMNLGNSGQIIGYTGIIRENGKMNIVEVKGINSDGTVVIGDVCERIIGVESAYSPANKHIPIYIYDNAYVVTWNRETITKTEFEKSRKKINREKMFWTFREITDGNKTRIVLIWLGIESLVNMKRESSVVARTSYNSKNESVAKLVSSIYGDNSIGNIKKRQRMIGASEVFDMANIDGLVHLTGANGKAIETDEDIRVPAVVDVIDYGAIRRANKVYVGDKVRRVLGLTANIAYGLKYETIVDSDRFSRINGNMRSVPVECRIGELIDNGIDFYTMPEKTIHSPMALSGIIVEKVLYKYPRKAYNDTNWRGNKNVKMIGIVTDKPFTLSTMQFSQMSKLESITIKGSGYIEAIKDRALIGSQKLDINKLDFSRCKEFGCECMGALALCKNSGWKDKIVVDVDTIIHEGAFMRESGLEIHFRKKVAYKRYKYEPFEITDETDDSSLKQFVAGLVYFTDMQVYVNASDSLINRLNKTYESLAKLKYYGSVIDVNNKVFKKEI